MKDFPEYGRPRWRIGKWERNFGYRWILTEAQVQLMQTDLPHTLYLKRDKKTGKAKKEYKFDNNDPAIAMQREANLRKAAIKKAKAEGKIPYTTEELFR